MAIQGDTTSITFATSGFTATLVSVAGATQERESIDDTPLATGTHKTNQPGNKITPGRQTFDFYYDPDSQPPITADPETITLTYPVPSGQTNGATKAGTGYIASWTEGEAVVDGLMVAQGIIQFDGKTGPTFTDAS